MCGIAGVIHCGNEEMQRSYDSNLKNYEERFSEKVFLGNFEE